MDMLLQIYNNEIPDFIRETAETPLIQRLMNVGMNCGCEYTSFPVFARCSKYSRYSHSLGTALIIWHFTNDKKQAIAGLLHDISTPVFAHAIDFLNNDFKEQTSTERYTKAFIENSSEIINLLKKYNLKTEEVSNYHIYPVADNNAPKLSADRLEYTLGTMLNFQFADLEKIKKFYNNIVIGINEAGEKELMFKNPDIAEAFSKISLKNTDVFISDDDRFTIQSIAYILSVAIKNKVIVQEDLYKTEPFVIDKIQNNKVCSKLWEQLKCYTKTVTSSKKPDNPFCFKVDTKKRYIDPYVLNKGRVSQYSGIIKEKIQELNNKTFDYYISGEKDD